MRHYIKTQIDYQVKWLQPFIFIETDSGKEFFYPHIQFIYSLVLNNLMRTEGTFVKEIRNEIVIKASPVKIWKILTDFERYPTWNPFIISIQGTLAAGNIIQVELAPPDAKRMKLKPRVLRVIPNQEFSWLGRILIPGIFDGEHIFELRDNKNETTTVIQREIFTGILVPFLKKLLDDNTRRGFESMNSELKKICEANSEGIPGN